MARQAIVALLILCAVPFACKGKKKTQSTVVMGGTAVEFGAKKTDTESSTTTSTDASSSTTTTTATSTSTDSSTGTSTQSTTATTSSTSTETSSAAETTALSITVGAAPTVSYGNTGTVTITLQNTGTAAITGLSLPSVSTPWSQTSTTCGTKLTKNQTCQVVYTFTSRGVETVSNALSITYSGGSANYTIAAIGSGTSITVTSVYSSLGNWNDYVKFSTPSLGQYGQTGTACDGSETAIGSCLHGGEKKKATLTGQTSCSGLTLADTLGAFNWKCEVESGSAVAYMKGLKEEKGLRDLVDSAAWKNNSFEVTKSGYVIAKSTSGAWWTNTVEATTANAASTDGIVTLSGEGKIFTVAASTTTSGYTIGADKIALVTLANARLTYSGRVGSGSADRNIVLLNTRKFNWIEARMSCVHATQVAGQGIRATSLLHSRIHNTEIERCPNEGIDFFTSSHNNLITRTRIQSCGMGIYSDSVSDRYYDLLLSNNEGYGIQQNGDGHIFVRVTAANQYSDGLNIRGDKNTLLAITGVNNRQSGLYVQASDDTTFVQVAAANNQYNGIDLEGANLRGAQLLVAHNLQGIQLYATPSSIFTHYIGAGNNSVRDCHQTVGGVNVGAAHTTCAPLAGSSHTVRTGASMATYFNAKVTTTEGDSDSDGTKLFTGITTWNNLSQFWMGWGLDDAAAFPSTNFSDICYSGDTCRVYDWRVKSSDTSWKNKSGDFSTSNGTFASSTACPAAVSGNMTITDRQTSANTFLVNAVEEISDGIGDDDGLCETDEACIYQPNIGSYLGENGLSTGTCTFSGGTITGVQMRAYTSVGN